MTTILNWSQQRKSNVTIRWIEQRKMSFLKLGLKNIKKSMHEKRNNFLKIIENNINRWTFHKKTKQNNNLLNKIAEQSRKRYHSMDCNKKEKHLNPKRNQQLVNMYTSNYTRVPLQLIIKVHLQEMKYTVLNQEKILTSNIIYDGQNNVKN